MASRFLPVPGRLVLPGASTYRVSYRLVLALLNDGYRGKGPGQPKCEPRVGRSGTAHWPAVAANRDFPACQGELTPPIHSNPHLMQGEIRIDRNVTTSVITDHNEPMDSEHPRVDGSRRRRTSSPADKIALLAACVYKTPQEGECLQREGLYSSSLSTGAATQCGVSQGKKTCEKVGKLTSEQAGIAKLTWNFPGRTRD